MTYPILYIYIYIYIYMTCLIFCNCVLYIYIYIYILCVCLLCGNGYKKVWGNHSWKRNANGSHVRFLLISLKKSFAYCLHTDSKRQWQTPALHLVQLYWSNLLMFWLKSHVDVYIWLFISRNCAEKFIFE